jgi:hypothetical protein
MNEKKLYLWDMLIKMTSNYFIKFHDYKSCSRCLITFLAQFNIYKTRRSNNFIIINKRLSNKEMNMEKKR